MKRPRHHFSLFSTQDEKEENAHGESFHQCNEDQLAEVDESPLDISYDLLGREAERLRNELSKMKSQYKQKKLKGKKEFQSKFNEFRHFNSARKFIKSNSIQFEIEDQSDVLKNLCSFINNGQIDLDSVEFERICTLVRGILSSQEVQRIETKSEQEIIISLPEFEVPISGKEFSCIEKYQEDEDILRLLTGKSIEIEDSCEKTEIKQ